MATLLSCRHLRNCRFTSLHNLKKYHFGFRGKLQNSLFPSDLRKYVCDTLDNEDRIEQRDWIRLAEKGLGLTFGEIRNIRNLQRSAGKSPTEILLDQWAEEGKTLKQFEVLMTEMRVRSVVLKMKDLNAGTSSNPGTPRESPRIRVSPGQHRGIVPNGKKSFKSLKLGEKIDKNDGTGSEK